MNVLVACEYSGRPRDACRRLGHVAVSCDLEPTTSPGWHYQGDVRDLLDGDWDLMVAHPPCTYLALSGVRWLHEDPDRWAKMRGAAEFFRDLLTCDIPRKAVENPIMHGYAQEIVGRNWDQVVEPWMFGDPWTKATGLWLDGVWPLHWTVKVNPDGPNPIHREPPGPDRGRRRSLTPLGMAKAMADQWGGLASPDALAVTA